MRLVSLLPSATEIVYALGLGDDLVGVTFECGAPAYRSGTTVVVGGRDTRGMSPGDIDAYVRAQVAAGADLYTLHSGALAGLDPDLILTQDLCRVCAAALGPGRRRRGPPGVPGRGAVAGPVHPGRRAGVDPGGGRGARVPDRAEALVDGLRSRLAAVRAAVAGRPRPRVAVVEWVDPPFGAGHWIPDLVDVAGGEPVATVAAPGPRRPPGRRCGPPVPRWCWWHRAGSASTVRPSRPPRWPGTSRTRRCGRWTRTG
ncbi:hypothetical protein V2I01_39620 [Micromonospora sp. BRA006-A]|nr:hypothetical protein [Micromonospora sp. BRA006-A]